MANKENKIITYTSSKVIIKWDRIGEALTKEEVSIMNKLLGKIQDYQEGK
jgi:hypothetical protein